MSDVSYIIPFRSGGEERTKNLLTVLDRLSGYPAAEIIVVEQDQAPTLAAESLPGHCTHLFAFNPGPFNKSWGFNVGFRSSVGDVVVFHDADIIMDVHALAQSVVLCSNAFDAVKPYDRLVDLTESESEQVRKGKGIPFINVEERGINREYRGEYICFCGGIFLMRRDVYEELGGFDENFSGWGGEDDAMTLKLHAMEKNTHIVTGQTAWHLWHECRYENRFGQPHYRQNCAMLKQYRRLGRIGMKMICDRHRRSMGRMDRYIS